MREHYVLPTIKDELHELEESTIFSKADMSSGYWHIKLDEESSKMTTFQTEYGRFRWLRLPFGLSVSAEMFQKRLIEALAGLEGVICIADDVVIHAKTKKDHEIRMKAFLNRCQREGIRLNKKKMKHELDSITFMGHTITREGLKPDKSKVEAIQEFPTPTNVNQLRSFLGIVNYLGKFINNCSGILQHLHNLVKKEVEWIWSKAQDTACLLYTSPSPRDKRQSRMPSSA